MGSSGCETFIEKMDIPNLPLSETQNILNKFPILKASWCDVGALLKLEKRCFSSDDAWPLLDIIAVLSSPGTIRLKIERDEQMIAFIAAERQLSSSWKEKKSVGWITTIAVSPEYRRKGIGSLLLSACESAINAHLMRLCVRRSNEEAIRLYERAGYKQVDIWHKYYVGGEDALVFEKNLTQV